MSRGAFEYNLRRRQVYFLYGAVALLLVAVLLVEWHKVYREAEKVQLKTMANTIIHSASALRQQWELEGHPKLSETDGIHYGHTQRGWPIIRIRQEIDCPLTWQLLSSRENVPEYLRVVEKKISNTEPYNSCFYEVSPGKWLEIFYENETIYSNVFLTHHPRK